ncbi:hypothetical protein HanHA300_Chr14g0538011 [Helianthus annuus]|nr:hypothetical protein HanHA300_Chr14g0538011 [Helianthus annuus]KAJ0470241.1 hypothetical protein HanIR_Chr14g0716601 [Helianthus annuus]
MLKWVWRYKVEEASLWKRVVDAIHKSNRSWSMLPSRNNFKGVWRKIVQVERRTLIGGLKMQNYIRGTVGNRRNIKFWLDPWLNNMSLKECFPNLLHLEKNKQ